MRFIKQDYSRLITVLKYIIIIELILIFTSCNKTSTIHGNLVDNFSKPVKDVDIRIPNSTHITKSDKLGNFNIDFSTSKFTVEFSKKNYIPVTRSIRLEKCTRFPFGTIFMYRIPDTLGVFFKDKHDFIKIPKVELEHAQMITPGQRYKKKKYFYIPSDSIFTIPIDSLERIEIYENESLPLTLVTADSNIVAVQFISSSSNKLVSCISILERDFFIDSSTAVRSFKPNYNEIYVYLNFQEDLIFEEVGETAYIFKFIEK